jgi:dihydrofolate synthase / folylpolyglutamate synthase
MNYAETIDYIFSALPMFHRVGPAAYKANLDNTIAICNILENPENGLKCIHVAGTNGKGSVSNMLASIFQSAGYKTGLYTSPHLHDFRERIRVNGEMVEKEWVIDFVEKYKPVFEKLQPSFFEMSTGMALKYFKEKETDIAIIETGLGGRLDSTNVITPYVSVITNIGHDHMNLLGDTIEKIAIEKAGIIKQNIPVVIGEATPEIKNVFLEKAKKENAEINFVQDHFEIVNEHYNPLSEQQILLVKRDGNYIYQDLLLDLTGKYQLKNLGVVLQTIELLKEKNVSLTETAIRYGLSHVKQTTGFSGRWQIINNDPVTICDTGHNKEGLQEVLPMLQTIPHNKLHIVLGVVNDKEIDGILKLFPKDAIYYFCKANIPRGLDAKILAEKAADFQLMGEVYGSVKSALRNANGNSQKNDLIFIGGSTFTVAEAL